MLSDSQKIARLESILTQRDNEVSVLQSTLKKLKKEYDHHLGELSQKIQTLEVKDVESIELRRNYGEKDHEIQLLKAKNNKLEEKIKSVLSGESQKIGEILNRNQALEKENLELHTTRAGLEGNLREISTQLNHYKNLNEAHEKHQAISKKNSARLEEQIEKLTKELSELKKKHISEASTKNEEIAMLGFRIEEYTNNIDTLKTELILKENRIKELSSNSALDQARTEIRQLEETKFTLQERLSSINSELDTLRALNEESKGKFERTVEDYEHLLVSLRKNLEDAQNTLREAQLENRKMQFELENEKSIRASIENFRIPTFHQDRLQELNDKYVEYQTKYHKAMEENKRLSSEIIKFKTETNQRFAEITKIQQDETKGDFAMLINKLQLSINRNKTMGDEIITLKKQIESQNLESAQLQDQIDKFISDIRTLTIENNKLKFKLNEYNPGLNLELLSREEVDEVKDKEIRQLRDKVRTQNSELQEKSRNTVDSQKLNQLKADYEALNEELKVKTEVIESLTNQLRILRQANAINNLVSGPVVAERIQERSASFHMEQDQDLQRQINELVQKRFEFENIKQRLTEENSALNSENRELARKFAEVQGKVKSFENQLLELQNKVNILEKEKKVKTDAIVNREKHLNDLILEQNRLRDERDQLVVKINQLEEDRERFAERVRFYEEHANNLNKINNDVLADKELYLKTILNQKNEITIIERRHKQEAEKILKEREELRQQLVSSNNEKVNALKKYYDATFQGRVTIENQNILITNFVKKIGHLETVITELDSKLTDYMKSSQSDYEKNLPKLSEISNILNKSRLTAEDYQNFEAIKELLSQQRVQYEESVKYLEGTIETLGQRYLALEEVYTNEKNTYLEQLEKLRKENLETIARYENKIKEYEEREKVREEARKAAKSKPKAQQAAGESGAMEIEEEEGEVVEATEELEGEGQDEEEQGDLHAEIESLKAELNLEREIKLKLESELEIERERARRSEEEKNNFLRRATDLEKEKGNLCKLFTLRETSWVEQKKEETRQIEGFRKEDEKRANQLVELTNKLNESQKWQLQAGEKEGGVAASDIRVQDLEIQIENLKNDNHTLKRSLEEKSKEGKARGEATEMETEEDSEQRQELETLRNENKEIQDLSNKLRDELEEMRSKVRILEEATSAGAEISQEDVSALTEENEAEILELKKAIDSGSLLSILEKAQSLLLAMPSKSQSS